MAQWWRDVGLIPGSGRYPGVGTGNLLQYSCLEIPMDRSAWWATVEGVINSWTWLSMHIHTQFLNLLPAQLNSRGGPLGGLSGRPLSCPWDSLTTYWCLWCLCWFHQQHCRSSPDPPSASCFAGSQSKAPAPHRSSPGSRLFFHTYLHCSPHQPRLWLHVCISIVGAYSHHAQHFLSPG